MKIRKSVSDKVIKANGSNAKLSPGPTSEHGKKWSRRGALKNGILAKVVLFKDEEEEAEFRTFLEQLQRDQKPRDMLELMQLEDLATSRVRLARALRLEQRLYRKRNMAADVLQKAIGANLHVLGVDDTEVPESDGWDLSSLENVARV
jgi:hypothetical protein